MSAALTVHNLRVRFPGTPDIRAVEGLDLHLAPGETVALVGESGCGKTVTAKAILGLLDRRCVSADSIELGGRELSGLGERAYRKLRGRKISMVFQEPLTALDPVFSIGKQLEEVLVRHGAAQRGTAHLGAREALHRLGLPDADQLLQRYPHQLSGGMRQRVLIAMAMACEPSVLIADEPTTALDVTSQARVLAHLSQMSHERGTAVLLITHDLAVAAQVCSRILVMQAGRIIDDIPTERLLGGDHHPHTQALLAAVPQAGKPVAIEHPPAGAPILSLEQRRVSHPVRDGVRRRRLVAVNDVSLDIRKGEILGLVGESGCGKSTLAQSLLGIKSADSGTLRFDGAAINGGGAADWSSLRRRVQLVFQDPRASLSPRRTVGESLAEPLHHFAIGEPSSHPQRVVRALQRVGLDPSFASRFPAELSGGQRQRVALARALVSEPDLIVADEPLSSLDVTTQARIIELLRELRAELGFAILLVSHDLAVIRQVADRVAVMYLGKIVESGPCSAVFERPAHPYTEALIKAIPGLHGVGGGAPPAALVDTAEPPSLLTPPAGCVFHTRCPVAMERCARIVPPEHRIDGDDPNNKHTARCLIHETTS